MRWEVERENRLASGGPTYLQYLQPDEVSRMLTCQSRQSSLVSQEYAPCHWSRIRLCTEVLVIQRGFTRGASALKLVMFCCFSVEGSVSGVLSRGPEVIWEVSMWMKPDANQTNPFKIKTNVS